MQGQFSGYTDIFRETCYTTLTLHVYQVIVTSRGGGESGGVTGEKAAKPVTIVQA